MSPTDARTSSICRTQKEHRRWSYDIIHCWWWTDVMTGKRQTSSRGETPMSPLSSGDQRSWLITHTQTIKHTVIPTAIQIIGMAKASPLGPDSSWVLSLARQKKLPQGEVEPQVKGLVTPVGQKTRLECDPCGSDSLVPSLEPTRGKRWTLF